VPSAEAPDAPAPSAVVCVDVGSTFTKALLVDLADGTVLASAEHPTTIGTDVLDGYDACRAALAQQHPAAATAPALACSSAGGGLRVAVVGNEELVTAEAGRRVALSSGGKVVGVLAVAGLPAGAEGGDAAAYRAFLDDAAPDVVLLTGGTDGGNADALVAGAHGLVAAGWRGPVVVAGNVDARDEVGALLEEAGAPAVLTDNVVPRIGVLEPGPARAAVREVFLAHVIGGKHLSRRPEFVAMVRGATPDVVLTGVELLARTLPGDVVVVDVGGATTDVHSVVELDPDTAYSGALGLSREVVATTPLTRTVEGDLGMRWSALTTLAALEERDPGAVDDGLRAAARRRHDDPGFVPDPAAPDGAAEAAHDEALAAAAVGEALRRHAGRSRLVVGPEGRVVERSGTDLREVALVVGSGGALRHGPPGTADRVLAAVVAEDLAGGWQLPRAPRLVVDRDYVLAAAGLLAAEHPAAAVGLVRHLLDAAPV